MRHLRLLAALAVVVGHGYVLTGVGSPPRIGGIPIHTIGLYTFFAVSGYVITKSWNRSPDLPLFLRNRALRILPALSVMILLTVTVIGPLATRLPFAAYLSDQQTWQYLSGLLLIPQYQLPGVFTDHPSPTVNGSLWTLGIEACCYLATGILGLALKRFAWVGMLALGALAVTFALQSPDGPLGSLRAVGAVCSYFAIGAMISHLRLDRHRLPLTPIAGSALAWIGLGSVAPSAASIIAWVIIPAVILTIATRSRVSDSKADLSYGVYLWGYPIQQLVLQVNPELPVAFSIALTAMIAAAVAALSWRHIESPALRLKKRTTPPERASKHPSAISRPFVPHLTA
jgi:peptidoglycan/LPS O-acetylase OafA/YrhL